MAAPQVYSSKLVTRELIDSFAKENKRFIGTHNTTHHCDEVLACALLHELPEYKDSPIIRTRDTAMLDAAEVVLDTGSVYDPERRRFDHHQREFGGHWAEQYSKVKMSSAGLVWKHYGKELLKEWRVCPSQIDFVHEELYAIFFASVDAQDNGVRSCLCATKRFQGGMPGLGGLVAAQNIPTHPKPGQNESTCFTEAYIICRDQALPLLKQYAKHLPAIRDEIKQAVAVPINAGTSASDETVSKKSKIVEPAEYIVLAKYFRHQALVRRYREAKTIAVLHAEPPANKDDSTTYVASILWPRSVEERKKNFMEAPSDLKEQIISWSPTSVCATNLEAAKWFLDHIIVTPAAE